MRARLLLLLLVAGCHRQLELGHRELPGFSIDVPRMLEARRSTLEYSVGELALAGVYRGDPLVVMVRWTPGEKLTQDELQAAGAAITSANAGTANVVNGFVDGQGHAVETLRTEASEGVLMMSQVTCGGRNLLVTTLHHTDQAKLHQRIISSLACHPDLEQEATLHDTNVPLLLDLPGWHAMSRDQNQLMLSSADGASIVMLQPMSLTGDDALDGIGPMLQRGFGGQITAGKRETDRVPLGGSIDGQKLTGYARMATCPSTSVFEIVLSSAQADASAVDAKLKAAKCLPPGARPPVWPDAPKAKP